MNTENQDNVRNGSSWLRWLRVGLLTFSMAGPVINTFLNQMRRRSQSLREQAAGLPDTARAVQTSTLQRVDELAQISRERAVEQAQLLRKQARQLQAQAKQLRKALRAEAKQRQKVQQLQKQLQKSGMALGQDWLKRGEVLTGDLIEQSNKLSHDLVKRSSKITHDLTERGSQATQELVKRGSKTSQALLERGTDVSQDLLKRGGKVSQTLLEQGGKLSHNVAERSGQMLEPVRKRDSRFWTIFGFTTGLFAASIVTYVLIRRRVNSINSAISDVNEDEQIELPQDALWRGPSPSHPSGEIRHIDSEGSSFNSVATMAGTKAEHAPQETTTEKLEITQTPADVAFVGVVSTKLYYPTDTTLEEVDVIYFVSEDEAKAGGFIPAPTE